MACNGPTEQCYYVQANPIPQTQYVSSLQKEAAACHYPYNNSSPSMAMYRYTSGVSNNSLQCSQVFNGNSPDCPTQGLGGCEWFQYNDLNTCSEQNTFWVCPEIKSSFCAKTAWDQAFRPSCCLGSVTGNTDYVFGPQTFKDTSSASIYCDPTWCPDDQAGNCGDIFAQLCNTVTTLSNGSVTHPFLAGSESLCGKWYADALKGVAPASRWNVIDTLVERYCETTGANDQQGCGCVNRNMYMKNTGPIVVYASTTALPPAGAGQVRQVNLINSSSNEPIGLSDYACIAPECQVNALNPTSLITSDIWYRQNNTDGCPEQLCIQVIDNGYVTLDNINVDASLYVDNSTQTCGGAMGNITVGAPQFNLSELSVPSTYFVSVHNGPAAAGASCANDKYCPMTIPIDIGLTVGSNPSTFSVANTGLPPGVSLGQVTTTATAETPGEINVVVDQYQLPLGGHDITFSVQDINFPSTRASLNMHLLASPTNEQPALQPNKPTVTPTYEVVTYVQPSWLWPAIGVIALLLIILFITQYNRVTTLWDSRKVYASLLAKKGL